MSKINKIKTMVMRQFKRIEFNQLKRQSFKPFEQSWFKGKRVAVIGGADSAFKEKNGNHIDNFDVVIRVNDGIDMIESYSANIGTRTDFLFHNMILHKERKGNEFKFDLWKKRNLGLVVGPYIEKDEYFFRVFGFLKRSEAKCPFTTIPKRMNEKNKKSIEPNVPTTGFTAINLVMQCQPKELFITGFTFFKTPHFKAYRDQPLSFYKNLFEKHKTHSPDKEFAYVKQLYLDYPETITTDKALRDILESEISH